uniref:Uncharacterized protein n=1 Tax=Arundo donax TaxID=35708 RepID=A0A0A9CBP9_ARUDO
MVNMQFALNCEGNYQYKQIPGVLPLVKPWYAIMPIK